MDEFLDTVPRPRAVIHVALAGLTPSPDPKTLDTLANIFAALMEAGRLAPRRWDDIYAAGDPVVRLLAEAGTSLAAPVLDLAKARGLSVVATQRGEEEVLEDCDCLLLVDAGAADDAHAVDLDPRSRRALARERPVILALPRGGSAPLLLVPLPDEFGLDAQRPIAASRETPTPQILAALLLAPPARHGARTHLAAYLEEGPPRASSRAEYDLLMRVLGPPSRRRRAPAPEPWDSACAILRDSAGWVTQLKRHHDIADGHALHYGEKWRSALVTRSFLLLISIVVLGLIGMLNQDLSLVTMPLQAVTAGFIFFDRWRALRGEWQRRWLEYRVLAERLRCLRYLRLAGVADAEGAAKRPTDWTAWYATRIARLIGPCAAGDPAQADAVLNHLLRAEMAEQIDYHRSAIRRFTALDLRIRGTARALLALTVTTGALMFAVSFQYPHFLSWSGIASLGLSAAPAIVTGLNAFRAEFDLMRLTERSARILSGLSRLSRAARARSQPGAAGGGQAATLGLDQAVARRAAALMLDEVAQWRFVLEARSARLKRR
ncbi:hypothetical protein SAMN05519104_4714 [Rhizobiales bacterium GAS188]|nr:hypothetical protein SAMN05519104_4714 [Rhizobiales bacterium GAS188]